MVETKGCEECCLLLVVVVHVDLSVSSSKVEGGEPEVALKSIESVVDTWEWIDIALGDSIEFPIVDAESPFATRLWNQNDRSTPRRTGRFDDVVVQHVPDMFLNDRSFVRGVPTIASIDWVVVLSVDVAFDQVSRKRGRWVGSKGL